MNKLLSAYRGSPNLKKIGVQLQLSQEQFEDYQICANDPVYFIEKYMKVITLDRGFTHIDLYDFQRKMIDKVNNNRRVVLKAARQTGKTTLLVGYILWYILFNEDKTVAILANKASTAREILGRVKLAYEALPLWIQQGVKTWNKGDIELENNSRVLANSTASTAIRGYSISLLYLDEFGFVPNNIAEDFFTSVYPTITSGKESKILISSTPNGMNHFYKLWKEAENNTNGFTHVSAIWSDVPGRDQAWADDQRRVLGDEKFEQEMCCEFLGSAGTLINSTALKALVFMNPIHDSSIPGLNLYFQPEVGHQYIMTVDTSRGKGIDFSAFAIIDVTQVPYRLVATYKDNTVSVTVYPEILKKLAIYYNNAYVLVEINDNGQQVVDTLFMDGEYENILYTQVVEKRTVVTFNSSADRGVRTTKSVKSVGCSNLKSIVESNKIIIHCFELISELSTFIRKKKSFEADEGAHDDLVMCLVLFAWLTGQTIFKDMTDPDLKQKLYNEQMRKVNEEFLPMPILNDHSGEKGFTENGVMWNYVN